MLNTCRSKIIYIIVIFSLNSIKMRNLGWRYYILRLSFLCDYNYNLKYDSTTYIHK